MSEVLNAGSSDQIMKPPDEDTYSLYDIYSSEELKNSLVCEKVSSIHFNSEEDTSTKSVKNPFMCHICQKSFSWLNDLRVHLEKHKADNSNANNEILAEESVSNIHHRTRTKEQHICYVCERIFSNKCSLDSHFCTHIKEKLHQCGICRKSFSAKGHLRMHLRTHAIYKPYVCSICHKEFSGKSNLNRHLRSHTGQKFYVCDMGKERFAQKDGLSKHRGTHTDQKFYMCSICQSIFPRLEKLKIHQRTHAGKKPYSCDICFKVFPHLITLQLHVRSHTPEKPYVCDFCHKRFSKESDLNDHHGKGRFQELARWARAQWPRTRMRPI